MKLYCLYCFHFSICPILFCVVYICVVLSCLGVVYKIISWLSPSFESNVGLCHAVSFLSCLWNRFVCRSGLHLEKVSPSHSDIFTYELVN